MAMRALTAIEMAANAAERWRRQYPDYDDEWRFADGRTIGETKKALAAEPRHTPKVIANILNDAWAYPQCDTCNKKVLVVVTFARDFSDEAHCLCADCLRTALTMAEQFESANPSPILSQQEKAA